jgi:hypothetical protein
MRDFQSFAFSNSQKQFFLTRMIFNPHPQGNHKDTAREYTSLLDLSGTSQIPRRQLHQ